MKTGAERVQLDEKIRGPIRDALNEGFTQMEIVFLLTRILPELTDFGTALGHVSAAFDLHRQRGGNRVAV